MSPSNVPASVRQRLLDHARAAGEEFGLVLVRYGVERLLYRLSVSAHRERFALKGAMLFTVWADTPHRGTRDLDLSGSGPSDPDQVAAVFRQVCAEAVPDDGIGFDLDSFRSREIREDQEYSGVRLNFLAYLDGARIPMQVDIGYGDVITPAPIEITYPTILDMPAPRLRAYTRETVVAEKFQAIVALSTANSRLKDFYDIAELANHSDFDGRTLGAALRATFTRRQTPLPSQLPVPLTDAWAADPARSAQWRSFLQRTTAAERDISFSDAVANIRSFVMPAASTAAADENFDKRWDAGGPWR